MSDRKQAGDNMCYCKNDEIESLKEGNKNKDKTIDVLISLYNKVIVFMSVKEQKIVKQEKIIRKLAGKIKGCPEMNCPGPLDCNFVECWRAWAEKGGISNVPTG